MHSRLQGHGSQVKCLPDWGEPVFAVTGHTDNNQITGLLPGILNQLGPRVPGAPEETGLRCDELDNCRYSLPRLQ